MTSGVKGSGNNRKKRTSVTMSFELHDAIQSHGRKPDTFEDILWRAMAALDMAEKQELKQEKA